jgi:hypothetical protein
MQLAASNRIEHLRASAAMIGEERGAALWNHPGLILHVLAAAGEEKQP